MARPICVHCGKAYGQRTTREAIVRWPVEDKEPPPYRGNGIVLREHFHGKTPGQDMLRKILPTNSGHENHRKWNEQQIARAPEKSENVTIRTLWDGQSWHGGYDPFCTLRCALDYARTAYARNQSLRNVR